MSPMIHYKYAAPWYSKRLFNSPVCLQPQQESFEYLWTDSTWKYAYLHICIYDTVIRVCPLVRCMANLSIRGVFDSIQESFVQIQNDSIQFTMKFDLIQFDFN